jgi:predicted translin family RNA/ssDNA-binding protein
MSNEPVKRGEIGIAGALIILSQAITSFQSTQSISKDMQELHNELEMSKREMIEFVRKSDFISLSIKSDKISDQLKNLKIDLNELKKRLIFADQECDAVELFARD